MERATIMRVVAEKMQVRFLPSLLSFSKSNRMIGRNMTEFIVGIDPGKNTGISVYSIEKGCLIQVHSSGIYEAMETIRILIARQVKLKIIFEDARKRGGKKDPSRLQGVGSVKRDSAIWQEFCEYYSIDYKAIPPMKNGTNWDKDKFRKVTGWTGRTNQHSRDAGVIAFAYGNGR
jgi:hypothetical protein